LGSSYQATSVLARSSADRRDALTQTVRELANSAIQKYDQAIEELRGQVQNKDDARSRLELETILLTMETSRDSVKSLMEPTERYITLLSEGEGLSPLNDSLAAAVMLQRNSVARTASVADQWIAAGEAGMVAAAIVTPFNPVVGIAGGAAGGLVWGIGQLLRLN
jgi:hypothetical protein